MQKRENALNDWLYQRHPETPFSVVPLAGDASFRRYFRLTQAEESYIVMDAPPEKEALTSFISVAHLFRSQGIHTPHIYDKEETQGFLLLEDLGDELLLHGLTIERAQQYYPQAMATIIQIQQCETSTLPHFDADFILQELSLFREWFLGRWLQMPLSENESRFLDTTFKGLSESLVNLPQVCIHRDFHSRNLLVLNEKEIGVIDFQDAMQGPFTYDLVSLLKDCYIDWPKDHLMFWVKSFYALLPETHGYSFHDFYRAFELTGLQRHLKVLGIFCRLSLRDHKPGYLRDLPRTFNYVMQCLEGIESLKPFYDFMQEKVVTAFLENQPS